MGECIVLRDAFEILCKDPSQPSRHHSCSLIPLIIVGNRLVLVLIVSEHLTQYQIFAKSALFLQPNVSACGLEGALKREV